MIHLSDAKSSIVLAIGSFLNFFAVFDPSTANIWIAFICGVLALIIALPKALSALLSLRSQIWVFGKTLIEDINKLRKK